MNYKKLINQIINSVKESQIEQLYYKQLFSDKDTVPGKNEFLFFIKPEITIKSGTINYEKILTLILNKINEYELIIHDVKILSAKYLFDYNLIAEHYGVINKLSNNARKYLSQEAIATFERIFNKPANKVEILGSFEFLKYYPDLSLEIFDYFNQNIKSEKIAAGTYVQKISVDSKEIFLINGFHPRQIEHFTAKGRSIVTFTLSGNLNWKIARNNFIGKTNPSDAKEGSIRNELLIQKEDLGLAMVSSSRNGVHLSAGPVEGLVELIRFNSDFSENQVKTIQDHSFGKMLAEKFSDEEIKCFLNNCNMKQEDKIISVFDLTEEADSEEAIEKLKNAMKF